MRVLFENEQNGLWTDFSTETPLMFLEKINGNSCGCEAVTYKPLEFDGQRFISANLTARTVEVSVNFGGKENGRFSRKAALARWEEIQRVFVPGQYGKLTWTDGENSRFIRCRTSETPAISEILPFLFGAKFELVADLPLWFDTVENEMGFVSGQNIINNPCGLTVPFCLDIPAGAGVFILNNLTSGKLLKMLNTGESYTIDTAACTVTTSGGELVNNRLSVDSEFFGLVPGDNTFMASGSGTFYIRWRKAYMGIGG